MWSPGTRRWIRCGSISLNNSAHAFEPQFINYLKQLARECRVPLAVDLNRWR